jgi:hypothetical protein
MVYFLVASIGRGEKPVQPTRPDVCFGQPRAVTEDAFPSLMNKMRGNVLGHDNSLLDRVSPSRITERRSAVMAAPLCHMRRMSEKPKPTEIVDESGMEESFQRALRKALNTPPKHPNRSADT